MRDRPVAEISDTHKRQRSVASAGLEPVVPASDRPQTLTLYRSGNGVGNSKAVCVLVQVGSEGFRIYRRSAHERGKVVSSTHRLPLPPIEDSWCSYWRLSRPQGHSAARRIESMKNLKDPVDNRTHDLQQTALPRTPLFVLQVTLSVEEYFSGM